MLDENFKKIWLDETIPEPCQEYVDTIMTKKRVLEQGLHTTTTLHPKWSRSITFLSKDGKETREFLLSRDSDLLSGFTFYYGFQIKSEFKFDKFIVSTCSGSPFLLNKDYYEAEDVSFIKRDSDSYEVELKNCVHLFSKQFDEFKQAIDSWKVRTPVELEKEIECTDAFLAKD